MKFCIKLACAISEKCAGNLHKSSVFCTSKIWFIFQKSCAVNYALSSIGNCALNVKYSARWKSTWQFILPTGKLYKGKCYSYEELVIILHKVWILSQISAFSHVHGCCFTLKSHCFLGYFCVCIAVEPKFQLSQPRTIKFNLFGSIWYQKCVLSLKLSSVIFRSKLPTTYFLFIIEYRE